MYNMKRIDIVKKLKRKKLIGTELGVACGAFSKQLVATNYFTEFYCIDKWNDHHSIKEYFGVTKYFKDNKNVNVLRSTFDEALSLFEDEYFDFVYIDGYAHTGQDNGNTLYTWFEKVKKGGIISGHDYHEEWKETVDVVDKFITDKNLKLNTTNELRWPSWWAKKI